MTVAGCRMSRFSISLSPTSSMSRLRRSPAKVGSGSRSQGTRVIGQHDNNVQFGQSRVLLVWNRLIFPNGRSIVLERQPGADAEGYAGLQDGVDYHWWDLAKAAGLSTLLSVGAELATNA